MYCRGIAFKLAVIDMDVAKTIASFLVQYNSLYNTLSYCIYSMGPQKRFVFYLVLNSSLSFSLQEQYLVRKQGYYYFVNHNLPQLSITFVSYFFFFFRDLNFLFSLIDLTFVLLLTLVGRVGFWLSFFKLFARINTHFQQSFSL